MIKRIWSRIPIPLKWFLGVLGAWFVKSALDSFVNKESLIRSVFYTTPRKLINIHLPDIFFIFAFMIVISILVDHRKRFKGLINVSGSGQESKQVDIKKLMAKLNHEHFALLLGLAEAREVSLP